MVAVMLNVTNPCETRLRWYECNGIDKENCPLWGKDNKTKEENRQ